MARQARVAFTLVLGVGLSVAAAAWSGIGFQSETASVGARDLTRWGLGVQAWLRDEPDSAGAQLARGVLLECLASPGRPADASLAMLSRQDRDACGVDLGRTEVRPGMVVWYPDLPAGTRCGVPARQAYEAALRRTPLPEARLRLAHLTLQQSGKPLPSEQRQELRALAGQDLGRPLSYLTWLFLGRDSERRGDANGADEAFGAAIAVEPRWSSARTAAASARFERGDFDAARTLLGAGAELTDDPWYSYPCRILTGEVRDALDRWMARAGGTR